MNPNPKTSMEERFKELRRLGPDEQTMGEFYDSILAFIKAEVDKAYASGITDTLDKWQNENKQLRKANDKKWKERIKEIFPEKKTNKYWHTRGGIMPEDIYKEAISDVDSLLERKNEKR